MADVKIIRGWDAIGAYFPFSRQTFERNHAKAMLRAGYVYKSYFGYVTKDGYMQRHRGQVWTFEPMIFAYLTQRQINDGRV